MKDVVNGLFPSTVNNSYKVCNKKYKLSADMNIIQNIAHLFIYDVLKLLGIKVGFDCLFNCCGASDREVIDTHVQR